jgi:hypothetical protein
MEKFDYKEIGMAFLNRLKRRFPDPVIRLGIVIAAFISLIIFIRIVIIPSELKEVGSQRTSVIERELAKDIHYAGSSVCGDCHEDEYEAKRTSYHQNVSCELCHGPASAHADDPSDSELTVPRERKFCPLCHEYNLSRPTGFPQVNPQVHNPLDPCITCHDPHDPKPEEVPKGCVACHAQIERTKSVSPHVFLECTTCHVTPEEHRIEPRTVRSTKPVRREFCAQCHGLDSETKGTPKVDISTHGEQYLCWQCHYPHMPEI